MIKVKNYMHEYALFITLKSRKTRKMQAVSVGLIIRHAMFLVFFNDTILSDLIA